MIVSPGWGSWPEANWMIFCEVCRNWDTPVQGLWPFWPCDPRNPETGTMSTTWQSSSKTHALQRRCRIIAGVCRACETSTLRHRHPVVWVAMSPLANGWLKAVPQSPSTFIQPSPSSQHYSSRLKWDPLLLSYYLKPQHVNSELLSTSPEQKWHSLCTGKACNLIIKWIHSKCLCLIMVDIWPTLQLEWQNSQGRGS